MEDFFNNVAEWMSDHPWGAALVIYLLAIVVLAVLSVSTHSISAGEFELFWDEHDDTPFASACRHGAAVSGAMILFILVPVIVLEAKFEFGLADSNYGIAIYIASGVFVVLRMITSYCKYTDCEVAAKVLSIISATGLLGSILVIGGIFAATTCL